MGRKTLPGGGSPISIRVSDQLKDQLATAASGLGLSEHDTLRLAMQIGFKHFAAIDHDLAATIMAQSGLAPKTNDTSKPGATSEKSQPHTVNAGPTSAVTTPSGIIKIPPQNMCEHDQTTHQPTKYGYGKSQKKSG